MTITVTVPSQVAAAVDATLADAVRPVYLEGKHGAKLDLLYSGQHSDTTFVEVDFTGLGQYDNLLIMVTVHSLTGTTPTLNFYMNALDPFGNALNLLSSAQYTAAGQFITGIGPGVQPLSSTSVQQTVPVPDHANFQAVYGGTVTAASWDVAIYGRVAS